MYRITFFVLIFFAFVSGCAMERSSVSKNDTRQCVANYSSSGSFWTGKQFKTYGIYQKINKDVVFDKTLASLASSGLTIQTSNKESGVISASQAVIMGEGKTVPVNAIISGNKATNEVKVELNFTLSGGLYTNADGLQEEFCKVLDNIK